jgi:hypothetical protein
MTYCMGFHETRNWATVWHLDFQYRILVILTEKLGNTGEKSFIPFRKIWLLPHVFSWTLRMVNNTMCKSWILNLNIFVKLLYIVLTMIKNFFLYHNTQKVQIETQFCGLGKAWSVLRRFLWSLQLLLL